MCCATGFCKALKECFDLMRLQLNHPVEADAEIKLGCFKNALYSFEPSYRSDDFFSAASGIVMNIYNFATSL